MASEGRTDNAKLKAAIAARHGYSVSTVGHQLHLHFIAMQAGSLISVARPPLRPVMQRVLHRRPQIVYGYLAMGKSFFVGVHFRSRSLKAECSGREGEGLCSLFIGTVMSASLLFASSGENLCPELDVSDWT